MKTTLGLDFGTTNSALAIARNGRVDVTDADENNRTGKTLRSVLFFEDDNKVFVGQEAITRYIEKGGEGRFLQSIKSFLPSTLFEYTMINGRKYELEDLIAIILRRLRERGEASLGTEISRWLLEYEIAAKKTLKDFRASQWLNQAIYDFIKHDGFVDSFKSRLCERSEAISQFVSDWKIEIAASLRSSQ